MWDLARRAEATPNTLVCTPCLLPLASLASPGVRSDSWREKVRSARTRKKERQDRMKDKVATMKGLIDLQCVQLKPV